MSRDDLFRTPKGVHDVLPPESGRWIEIVARFADRARRYGYGLAITPMFEHVEVFQRVGEHTDVVSKEMYELTDKGGRKLALRPEGTASVVRAYVQHRPTPPWKVWYVAPNFRYERAQKGRYTARLELLANPPYDRDSAGTIIERYARALEAEIRTSPADWLWVHRKWKYPREP